MQDSKLTSRAIRSFVVRNGRMTDSQARAIEELMPRFGIDFQEQAFDFESAFGRAAPLWVETGFGNGDALLSMALQFPEKNFLGLEVHAPGVGHLLAALQENEVENVRVIRHDAMEVFSDMLKPGSVERALLFFPDPWPKKRHHKRRILQPEFASSIERVLENDGVLHCATDWEPYAAEMLELLNGREALSNSDPAKGYSDKPDYRLETRFERRGLRLGHGVYDLLFQKV